jgi:hypothetical protein
MSAATKNKDIPSNQHPSNLIVHQLFKNEMKHMDEKIKKRTIKELEKIIAKERLETKKLVKRQVSSIH